MTGRSVRHALEYGAFRVARWTWGLLPEAIALRVAAVTGLLVGTVLRVRRRDVDRHIERAFPDRPAAWRARVARRSYMHLAREAAMLFRMGRWSSDRLLARVEFDGIEELQRTAEGGAGAVLLTGHLGNWEIAGAAVAALGIPISVVGKGMANRSFEADLFEARDRVGMRVIDMMDAPKGVLRALRDGQVVAMLVDQNAHKSDTFVPFFGTPAATARGPALFVVRTGAPVFLGTCVRAPQGGQRYEISCARMDFRPTGDVEEDTRVLLTEYARRLEEAIREAPEQYFWHHKRWKTRPPEELPAGR